MSVRGTAGSTIEAVRERHRQLVLLGAGSALIGLILAAYIAWEWFVMATSHEVLAVIAAVAFLVGVQVLVLSSLSSMLIALNRERAEVLESVADE